MKPLLTYVGGYLLGFVCAVELISDIPNLNSNIVSIIGLILVILAMFVEDKK